MKIFLVSISSFLLLSSLVLADIPALPAPKPPNNRREDIRAERAAKMKAQSDKVREACAADVATAKCKEGPVLTKCMSDYKAKNPGFQFNDACMKAMRERTDLRLEDIKESRKARKQARRERRQMMAPVVSGDNSTK